MFNKFLEKIDWKMLKFQKLILLRVIKKNPDHAEDLRGILHLIDGLQDFAVGEAGYPEEDVFGLGEDKEKM